MLKMEDRTVVLNHLANLFMDAFYICGWASDIFLKDHLLESLQKDFTEKKLIMKKNFQKVFNFMQEQREPFSLKLTTNLHDLDIHKVVSLSDAVEAHVLKVFISNVKQ